MEERSGQFGKLGKELRLSDLTAFDGLPIHLECRNGITLIYGSE